MDDHEDLYGESLGSVIGNINTPRQVPAEHASHNAGVLQGSNGRGSDIDIESGSSSESDSDIEVIIAPANGQRAEPPSTKSQPYAGVRISKTGASNSIGNVPNRVLPVAKLPEVDIDAVAEMDGKSILGIDLEGLQDKPWRLPGADITDYFNYGFDEFTWTAYCQKQTRIRQDFAPDKVMQGMIGAMDNSMMNPMNTGLMMPPMDPGMMQQFYGSMPIDFLPGPTTDFGSSVAQNHSIRHPSAPREHSNVFSGVNQIMEHKDRDDITIPRGPSQARHLHRSRAGLPAQRW